MTISGKYKLNCYFVTIEKLRVEVSASNRPLIKSGQSILELKEKSKKCRGGGHLRRTDLWVEKASFDDELFSL